MRVFVTNAELVKYLFFAQRNKVQLFLFLFKVEGDFFLAFFFEN